MKRTHAVIMGLGFSGFAFAAWRYGFWFRGRHVVGPVSKIVALAFGVGGVCFLAVAVWGRGE